MNYKNYIALKLNIDGFSAEEIEKLIILPPDTKMGDYALPCFRFAKALKKAPNLIAEDLQNSFVVDQTITKVPMKLFQK